MLLLPFELKETWKWLSALLSQPLSQADLVSVTEGSHTAVLGIGSCLQNLLHLHISQLESSLDVSESHSRESVSEVALAQCLLQLYRN